MCRLRGVILRLVLMTGVVSGPLERWIKVASGSLIEIRRAVGLWSWSTSLTPIGVWVVVTLISPIGPLIEVTLKVLIWVH